MMDRVVLLPLLLITDRLLLLVQLEDLREGMLPESLPGKLPGKLPGNL
jgi:hypothetical protein